MLALHRLKDGAVRFLHLAPALEGRRSLLQAPAGRRDGVRSQLLIAYCPNFPIAVLL